MIQVTRLNKQTYFINPHLIESIEETPDTVITFVTGTKILVLESAREITERIIQYRQRLGEAGREPLPAGACLKDRQRDKPKKKPAEEKEE